MTTEKPQWLPEMVSTNGSWDDVLARFYAIFVRDFKKTQREFQTCPVCWDTRVLEGAYEEGFWHLITRTEAKSQTRLFDPRRAERLPWCGPTISNCQDAAVRIWDYQESHGRLRTYLWLEAWDYVIILEKRGRPERQLVFLITAFHVDGDSQRRSLRRKYQQHP